MGQWRATENGLTVCAPIHDAFLIEANSDAIEADASRMEGIMREASELVLPRFPLRTEVKIVRYTDRYSDPRGAEYWAVVWRLLDGDTPAAGGTPATDGTPTTGGIRPLPPAVPPSSLISLVL